MFLPKPFLQRVWGVYTIFVEIPRGRGGGLLLCLKNGNSVEEGVYPLCRGYGYFLELQNVCAQLKKKNYTKQ